MKSPFLIIAFSVTLILAGESRGGHERFTPAQEPSNRLLKHDREQSKRITVRRVALVIGNGAYTNAPSLRNPPNDARDMAAMLKELGFDVISGINIGQREMKSLIRDFGQKLKAGGVGLFYYAGHGLQSRARNYLIPVEADIQSEAEIEDAENDLNIVILDACRNNPFSRSFRSVSNGLAQVDAPTGTLIAYATAPGHVASDGSGKNGIYTSELLKQMGVSGLSLIDMFMRVRVGVMKQTGSRQVPWESSSLVGQFCFSGGCGENDVTLVADPDVEFWNSIKNSTDAEDFRAYKKAFPNGRYVPIADNNLRRLEQAKADDKDLAISKNPATQSKNSQSDLTIGQPPRLGTIYHGPKNLASAVGLYEIRDERGNVHKIRLTAKAVAVAASNQLDQEVSGDGSIPSHLWDGDWYYWRLPKESMLLLAWRDLTQNSQGWVVVQKDSNGWQYRTDYGNWKEVMTGQINVVIWIVGGKNIAIHFQIPGPVEPWTSDDVWYRFQDQKATIALARLTGSQTPSRANDPR